MEATDDSLEKSILDNEKLVYFVAKKFFKRASLLRIEFEDLVSEGMIGLIKAIRNFDANYGVKFSTYAVPMIEGQMRRLMRDTNPGPKFSRLAKELSYKLDGSESPNEVSEKFHANIEIAKEAIAYKGKIHTISMDKPINKSGEKDLSISDLVGYTEDFSSIEINEFLTSLSPKLNKVVRMIAKGKTQQEIGKVLKCSQVHVSRMLKKIRDKYTEYLSGGNKDMPVITVDEYKSFKEQGKSDADIARQLGIKQPSLTYHKKRWAMTDIQPNTAEVKPTKCNCSKDDKSSEYERIIGELKHEIQNQINHVEKRDNKINDLNDLVARLKDRVNELENIDAACDDVENETDSLREENESLKKLKYHNDYIIENQKYQLEKWAKEVEDLQEENKALKFFAKKYLAVE